jgi:hypothetical protein
MSTGGANSFFGEGAGAAVTTGSSNTFVGSSTGGGNFDGDDNTIIGAQGGEGFGAGSKNTFVGTFAGVLNGAPTDKNTIIGFGAVSAGTGSGLTNATAIGAQAQVSRSDSLVLGSINGVNQATTDTNVGIGTTAPQDRLHVNGNVRVTNGGIYISNPNTLVITSPNGACWGITVNNSGALSTFPVTCPQP